MTGPSKGKGFRDRHFAGDQEALPEAISEAASVFVDGKLSSRRDDLGNALVNFEVVRLVFNDLSFLELIPVGMDSLCVTCEVGWTAKSLSEAYKELEQPRDIS
jgi:hypothetical protein